MHVLEDTVKAIAASTFPTKKISIILGAEFRDKEGIKKSHILAEKYKDTFENIWVNEHVMADNEIVGKSSNMASAGKFAKAQLEKLGWDFEKVTVTSCDSDSILPEEYFAQITYEYVTREDARYKYFVGAILFYSNIWDVSFFARVRNSIGVLYNISKLARPDKLVPFSTYTTSFWLVDQFGYWTPWVTPEDFHLFFKGVFYAPDKVSAVPIHQRVFSDAAEGEGAIDTFKNNYYQSRRWSWGVSDDGWMLQQAVKLFKEKRMTFMAFWKVSHVIMEHTLGLIMTFVIVLGSNLPFLLNKEFASTVFGTNLPIVSGFMVQVTIWFLVVLIIMDYYFIKPKEANKKKLTLLRKIFSLLEWVTLPYVGFFLVIIPGLEAHTRLIFGKYLEYYLTKKQ
jgi:hypothetical protein